MSSYFDDKNRKVAEAFQNNGLDEFLKELKEIEAEVYADVTLLTGDPEFPDDMREKIMQVLAVAGVYQPEGLSAPERAVDWAIAIGSSRMIEALHDLFHEVAGRRVETRFGLLSDNPRFDRERRDEEDAGS
jgi:hypothetical protein